VTNITSGLYDDLIDLCLKEGIEGLQEDQLRARFTEVDSADIPQRIAEVVATWIARSLDRLPEKDRTDGAIELSKRLLSTLHEFSPGTIQKNDELATPLRRLAAIETVTPDGRSQAIGRPLTPLRDTVLMTNARGEPGVGRELAAEIESADRIDLVCAFIRWTGIREMMPALRRHVESGRALRIITTVYTGTTEPRALEMLQDIGALLRISYDTSKTRLHAKAWHFHRSNGHSTVYIGSSNLTHWAQVTGLEWNVRAAQRTNPALVEKFDATFASYWADSQFEDFDNERFRKAVERSSESVIDFTPFEIEPYPFQRQILEQLQVERSRGRMHNLVVAATGTGKTILAGLDYRALRASLPRARLLFVAHRREILEQSQATFRHILREGAFGELWLSGHRPQHWEHVFASIQTLSRSELQHIAPDHFDVIIVDEFHHAAAESYEAVLSHLQPQVLLGLTATPERADGKDIRQWFGGRIAVELRLWDALEQELLSPFHYFGIHDGTDLRKVTWRRGRGYDIGELTNVYTANDIWASMVLQAVQEKIGDPKDMRALGFCVSIAHAQFMAQKFERAGLRAVAVTSATPSSERGQALEGLRAGRLQVLFTVDLFNEGVDVPAIDAVLMLRPTESATIFLQQLGRGLRRTEGKDVLTVLDFVGHQRAEFRFDLRYRRLLGRSRKELEADIEQGFPYLPAGCHLELDPVARDIVLANIKASLPSTWRRRVGELRELGDVPLKTYLEQTDLDVEDLYRNGHYWTELRRAAGHASEERPANEAKLGRGIGRLLHVDDEERLGFLRGLMAADSPPRTDELDIRTSRQLHMVLLTIFSPKKGAFNTLQEGVDALWAHPGLIAEAMGLLAALDDRVVHLQTPLSVLDTVPLQVHAHYTRDEVLAAFGIATLMVPHPLQAGAYWHRSSQTDLFFVTLQKTEKEFSPSTRYKDYAISDQLFHWESQSVTSTTSETGRRYLRHGELGTRILLFVRTSKTDGAGRTLPYFCAGFANYVSHESDRPIAIPWQLENRLPGNRFAEYRAAVA
jgi:superfamily II DNA or RNA helicase